MELFFRNFKQKSLNFNTDQIRSFKRKSEFIIRKKQKRESLDNNNFI